MLKKFVLLSCVAVLLLGVVGCQASLTQEDVDAFVTRVDNLEVDFMEFEEVSEMETVLVDEGIVTDDYLENFVNSNKESIKVLAGDMEETELTEQSEAFAMMLASTVGELDYEDGDAVIVGNTYQVSAPEDDDDEVKRVDLVFEQVDGQWRLDNIVLIPGEGLEE